MARSQSDIYKLIERVKEHNTRQKVASENNVPVIARIKKSLGELEALKLSSPRLLPYQDSLTKAIQESHSLLEDSDFSSYSEKVAQKEQLISLLEQVVEKMYVQMERELNESRN